MFGGVFGRLFERKIQETIQNEAFQSKEHQQDLEIALKLTKEDENVKETPTLERPSTRRVQSALYPQRGVHDSKKRDFKSEDDTFLMSLNDLI